LSDPAPIIARLIEYGTAPPADPAWPRIWWLIHTTISTLKGGSRDDRMTAFYEVTEEEPGAIALRNEVLAVLPPRENRNKRNRDIYNAADAFKPPPEREWCVRDLLPRRTLNLLAGDPGSKKTLLALDLAVCVALGKPWLGRPVTQSPVLVIDEETGKPRLWARIHASLLAHDATPETPFHYMSLPNFDLRDPDECYQLLQAAESVKAGLIVIDALADVIRGSDENSVRAVHPFFIHMRYIAEATHSAVLILHHNNKSGSFRGSSIMSAGVDLLLSIESAPASTRIDLVPIKTRDAAPEPFSARAHFEPDRFHLTPETYQEGEGAPAPARQNTATAILDLLTKHGQADTESLLSQLPGVTLGTVRNCIHQLKLSGLVERADKRNTGAKALYKLSVKGLEVLTIYDAPASEHDDD
jgi:hypothetical protein